VAAPVEGLLDLGDVLEFVEVLSLAATVAVGTVPVAGVVADAAVAELDEGVVLVTTAVPEVRSTTPMFGDTRLGVGSEAADAVPELLDPSAPQAARPNVRRLHNTILRMCARTTKADFFIDHYPG
jgi:hypothetical protein